MKEGIDMHKIQKDLFDYIRGNKYFAPLIKHASIMALIYPIYTILIKFSFFSFIWQYVGIFSSLLFLLYYAGTIICFAGNNLVTLSAAFGCLTVGYLLSFQYGFSLNTVVNIIFFGVLAYKCFTGTKIEVTKEDKKDTYCFCPVCGTECSREAKFCNSCGTKLK